MRAAEMRNKRLVVTDLPGTRVCSRPSLVRADGPRTVGYSTPTLHAKILVEPWPA